MSLCPGGRILKGSEAGRAMRHSMLLLFGGMLALQGCGPNWQPSWNTSPNAAIPRVESLTLRRVTGGDGSAEALRTDTLDYEAMRAPAAPPAPMTPDDALRLPPPPAPRSSSSTPPPQASVPPRAVLPTAAAPTPIPTVPAQRVEGSVIPATPGQPAGVVAAGSGRTQVFNQPGTAGGGIAVQDGGTTTIIGPGGRITSVPSTR